MNREAIEQLAARMKDRAMTCPRGGFTKKGMTIASVCSDLDKFADELRAIAALEAGRSGGADPALPCDVRLPPATTINAGCKLSTLLHAMELRKDAGVVHFPPKAAPQQPPPVGVTDAGWRDRYLRLCDAFNRYATPWMRDDGDGGYAGTLARMAAALSHQQPAPSDEEAAEAYRTAHAAGEAHGRTMAAVEAAAPVSEPAASALPPGVTLDHDTTVAHWPDDAASGEGPGLELEQVVMFLLGEDEIHGTWFGENPGAKGNYWWRMHLRDAWNRHEARRLTTTGQGDVERLVEAALNLQPFAHENRADRLWQLYASPEAARQAVTEAFGQQQEASRG